VVWAEDRATAITRMRRALDEFDIAGIETLVDFHRAAMEPGGEFSAGGTCRELVADPVPALEALPRLRGQALSSPPPTVSHPQELVVEIDGKRATMLVHDPAGALPEPPPVRPRAAGGAGAPGEVTAPIPGNVLQVLVEAGQTIHAGEVVCILEAMKMENEIASPAAGTVEAVRVQPGEAVAAGHVLVSVAAEA
jgi:acetyl-CoA/propionyl-CoA carboxylase biotin carboxyl carrier protein